jgi:hypothetical protein
VIADIPGPYVVTALSKFLEPLRNISQTGASLMRETGFLICFLHANALPFKVFLGL